MQRTSHVSLLVPCPEGPARRPVDAIVVPSWRSARNLAPAIGLAHDLGCLLLLLCGDEATAAEAAGGFGGARGVVVHGLPFTDPPLPDLPTVRQFPWFSVPYADAANKRNAGLLIAKVMGWTRVLFLDDDIFGLRPAAVEAASAAMAGAGLGAVGWRYTDFPDNSVACHALRSSGRHQDVFLGAGALLVDVSGDVPYFPAVYNEDWLFWHDFAAAGRLGEAGLARQVRFNPFEDPDRAGREEFGDVLAEGLYALIHQREPLSHGCRPTYWPAVIRDRQALLDGVVGRLRQRVRGGATHTQDGYEIAQVLEAVGASTQALATVTPGDLAAFTTRWRSDLALWTARCRLLPRFTEITDALKWLGITDVHLVGVG